MDEFGQILGRGRGGPSNPARIGFAAAGENALEAAEAALKEAGIPLANVTDVCAGLAGVGRAENAVAMSELLNTLLPGKRIEVCTDLDLALESAGRGPAIVLVAGTGSAAIGRDEKGRVARAGGHGPAVGDEGSAFDVGKNAVEVLQRSLHGADAELGQQILQLLGCKNFAEVGAKAHEDADAVYPRLFPLIAKVADVGNETARNLLRDAASKLAMLAEELQIELGLHGREYILGKTGGMVGRSAFFDEALNLELRRVAPEAKMELLSRAPAEAAARRALKT